jgi:hypothetical protein
VKPLEGESLQDLGLSGMESLRRRHGSAHPPVPRVSGLHGMLSFGSQMSPRTNAGALEESVQQIMDRFAPLAEEFSIERPRDIQVQVRKGLPMLSSGFDFGVIDDPAATKRLQSQIQQVLRPGKYPVTEAEWRPAARALEPFVKEGNLKVLMNLGVANGPWIRRTNMRDAIVASLWLAGLVTAPQSASFSDRRNRAELLRPIAEMAVAGRKGGQGKAFGVGGPQLARAMPYVDLYAASIGLRGGPQSRGNLPLTPEIFGEEGVFQPMSRIARKDLREAALAAGGVSVRAARASAEENAAKVMKGLKATLSMDDQRRVISAMGMTIPEYKEAYKKDPSQVAARTLAVLSDPKQIDFDLPLADRRTIVEEISGFLAPAERKNTAVPTRFTKTAVQQGRASPEEAMRELRKAASKMPNAKPGIARGLGPAPFILALAAVISSGLAAFNKEEAA